MSDTWKKIERDTQRAFERATSRQKQSRQALLDASQDSLALGYNLTGTSMEDLLVDPDVAVLPTAPGVH